MVFFLVAFGLLLHVLFWGAGLALLLTPSRWRNCWPVFCAPAGLALQSAVVWAGVYSGLEGTNAYGRWSELIPVVLLAVAWWRHGGTRLWIGVTRFSVLGLLMAACLYLLVQPMSKASPFLTTTSLGSSDAADYAAGARVLQEFSRTERGGFLGLTEVVQVASVDNFYDYWLRLNHFTPSALIALNGAVLKRVPYEITGLLTAVLLALSLPAVFWMARAVLRYSRGVSLWIAAIYGLSPVTWYAVAHVAMGQLVAALAIACITWVGVALWRGQLSWRRGWGMSGLLFMAYWLVVGSYNFIILICLVPALAYAGGSTLMTGEWKRLGQWLVLMLAPLVACSGVFFERLVGLVERFTLLRQYDFGWRIPALSPEGWLGAVKGTEFGSVAPWLRLGLSLALLMLLTVALVRDAKSRRGTVYRAMSLMLPILAGYGYLEIRGALLGNNASYDAYKLFAVFYPGLLAGFCYWTTLSHSRVQRWLVNGVIVLVTFFNLSSARGFALRMKAPPWVVDRDLVELQRIERMPEVTSVNVRVPDMWSRLWANALLLRKPQYFYWHTYEGRRDTFLRGERDLNGGLIQTHLPGADSVRINAQFSLLNTHSPYFFRPRNGTGWHDLEREPRTGQRWRWTQASAVIHLETPTPLNHPLRTSWRFLKVHSLVDRDFQVWVGGKQVSTTRVGTGFTDIQVPDIIVPPGGTMLELRTSTPLVTPAGDSRALGLQIFGIEVEVPANGRPMRGM